MKGKWFLRYSRYLSDRTKEESQELSCGDYNGAKLEASVIFARLRDSTRRQFLPTDPISDPQLVYEESLG